MRVYSTRFSAIANSLLEITSREIRKSQLKISLVEPGIHCHGIFEQRFYLFPARQFFRCLLALPKTYCVIIIGESIRWLVRRNASFESYFLVEKIMTLGIRLLIGILFSLPRLILV
jgi:hypothetical protein